MSEQLPRVIHPGARIVDRLLALVRGESEEVELSDLAVEEMVPVIDAWIQQGELDDLAANYGPLSDGRKAANGNTLILLVRTALLEEYGGVVPLGGGLMNDYRVVPVQYLPEVDGWRIVAMLDAAAELPEEPWPWT